MNDTEETKVAGPSGPRISTGPAVQSLFSLTGPNVNILATQKYSGNFQFDPPGAFRCIYWHGRIVSDQVQVIKSAKIMIIVGGKIFGI